MRGILKHDFYAGIVKNLYKLLAVFVIFVMGALWAYKAGYSDSVSFSEALAYIFCGKEPFYTVRGEGNSFELPVIWLVIQIYISYIICSYPSNDLNSYGINLIVRTKSRYKWWLGKVIWCVLINLIIYMAGFFAVMCVAGFDFENMWTIGENISAACLYDFTWLGKGHIVKLIMLMPVLTSVAMSLLQMLLIFIFNEIAAYGAILFLCVAGVYYASPLFVSSNSMAIRNASAYLAGTQTEMIIIDCVVAALSVILGCIVIKRKNIYEN